MKEIPDGQNYLCEVSSCLFAAWFTMLIPTLMKPPRQCLFWTFSPLPIIKQIFLKPQNMLGRASMLEI